MKEKITTPQPRKEILQGKKKEVSQILSVWEKLSRDQLPNSSIRATGKIQEGFTFQTRGKYLICLPCSYVLFWAGSFAPQWTEATGSEKPVVILADITCHTNCICYIF